MTQQNVKVRINKQQPTLPWTLSTVWMV